MLGIWLILTFESIRSCATSASERAARPLVRLLLRVRYDCAETVAAHASASEKQRTFLIVIFFLL